MVRATNFEPSHRLTRKVGKATPIRGNALQRAVWRFRRLTSGWPVLTLLFALAAVVNQPAHAQTYKIIYAFNGSNKLTAGSSIVRDKTSMIATRSPLVMKTRGIALQGPGFGNY
jgi:hypothetical protein